MSNGHGRSTGGFGISRDESVRLIVQTSLDNGVTNLRQIAYILATAQHETRDFTAPEEDFGRAQARKLGYRGGEEYFGRGYVHLTHKDNYEAMDRRLGLRGALARDPSLATDPGIAARILVVGMRDGLFTGRRLDSYVDDHSTDFRNARRTVNGVIASKPWSVKAADECERFARAWERQLPELIEDMHRTRRADASPDRTNPAPAGDGRLQRGDSGTDVRELQHRLNALGIPDRAGARLEVDGDFGRKTFEAITAFQRAHNLEATGVVDGSTLAALAKSLAVHGSGIRQGHQAAIAADADGQLRHGKKGPEVESLQQRLSDLGYRGRDGKPLAIDADFGDNTRFALQAFQRDHGLQGLGVAGPKTAAALDRAEGRLISHPCHAHHALYAQVLEKVHAEERSRGVASGHHSQRIAAALAVECLRDGVTPVDRVELSRDMGLVRAVQVSPVRDEPGLNRSTDGISTAQAAQQSMLESTEQIRQVAVNLHAQQRAEQQRTVEPQPARAQPAFP